MILSTTISATCSSSVHAYAHHAFAILVLSLVWEPDLGVATDHARVVGHRIGIQASVVVGL